MFHYRHCLVLCLTLLPASAYAQITLYNETLGNLPGDQGWFVYITNTFTNATQTYVPGQGTQLVTNSSAMAGYFNKNPLTGTLVNASFPVLDRNAGFRISLDLLISSESHSSNDRAGFSIIALSSDRRGIEMGFWMNEIWAQNDSPLFTHGEGVAFNTTLKTHYDLTILGDNYDLSANGSSVLTGALRDYSSFGLPYTNPNFLFLGDDTSSASADITLGRVSLVTAIPEPMTWISLACIALGLTCFAWKKYWLPARQASLAAKEVEVVCE